MQLNWCCLPLLLPAAAVAHVRVAQSVHSACLLCTELGKRRRILTDRLCLLACPAVPAMQPCGQERDTCLDLAHL